MIRSAVRKCSQKFMGQICRPQSTSANSTSYDMSKYFTHSSETGYERHSSFTDITVPNLRIDQFVWKDYLKWQNKTAVVSVFFYIIIQSTLRYLMWRFNG